MEEDKTLYELIHCREVKAIEEDLSVFELDE